ncbi:S8 family serine peptidase [Kribbella sp. NPDC048915]|uniref:S8 family serine peptidase n=1 Tax=Kribbella sp. NPDC048915 TaxID=3155148 RepID=UPI0033EA5452
MRELSAVDSVALRADADHLDRLWPRLRDSVTADDEARVWLDARIPLALDTSRNLVGAPPAWDAGYDGTGRTVAVLDTGVDAGHPDLVGKVRASKDFTGEGQADVGGHGTHVAATIAGTGAASSGAYRGVAPGATLLDGKVCGVQDCLTSAILEGMEWAAEQGAQVVNMSLGGWNQPGLDPMELAVERLTASHDVLFVTAAGNLGAASNVSSPASAPSALAVGAVDDDRAIASFSSRGDVDGLVKPEIVAPGVGITAARSSASPGSGPYLELSGTSMATPHVAGAAAVLAQRHPDWSAAQLKSGLVGAASPLPEAPSVAQGAGLLDIGRAVAETVVAAPSAVMFGRVWDLPDAPVTRAVTYRNSGSEPVTLKLSFAPTTSDGAPAPAGMFQLSADEVTVPANGSAQVEVTVVPRVEVPEGYVGGRLVATAGAAARVSTPVGLLRDQAAFDVTLRQVPRPGAGPAYAYAFAFGLDRSSYAYISAPVDADGTELRLRAGRHIVVHGIETDEHSSLLVQPELVVDRPDQEVIVDARKARPISITLPDPRARLRFAEVATSMPKTYTDELGSTTADYAYLMTGKYDQSDPFAGEHFGQAGPNRDYDGVTTELSTTWSRPRADGSLADSPEVYFLNWFGSGRAYSGSVERVRANQLATVTSTYAAQAQGARGAVSMNGTRENGADAPNSLEMSFPLPFKRTEHYNNERVRWERHFLEMAPGLVELAASVQEPKHYVPPRRYTEAVNEGVFAPSVAAPTHGGWARRVGNTMVVRPPTFADGAGRIGDAATTQESTTLYRNGVKVAAAPRSGYRMDCDDLPPAIALDELCPTGLTADVTAADGLYRLVVAAERGAPHALSTRVTADWTFRSATVAGERPKPLPLTTLRFAPDLDAHNAAPAGRTFTLPVLAEPQPGSAAGTVRDLAVDVCYDDGATWQPAHMVAQGPGGRFMARLRHPKAAGFVSLRAHATDTRGNTVKQTVIRAYRIG